MRFRTRLNVWSLESRDNPSDIGMIDPYGIPPPPPPSGDPVVVPPADPAPAPAPSGTPEPIDPYYIAP